MQLLLRDSLVKGVHEALGRLRRVRIESFPGRIDFGLHEIDQLFVSGTEPLELTAEGQDEVFQPRVYAYGREIVDLTLRYSIIDLVQIIFQFAIGVESMSKNHRTDDIRDGCTQERLRVKRFLSGGTEEGDQVLRFQDDLGLQDWSTKAEIAQRGQRESTLLSPSFTFRCKDA